MQIARKQTKIIVVTAILMFTISSTLFALPIATAHDPPWNVPTYAYVNCAPSTVGVNQHTTIVCWIDKYSPTAGGANGQCWQGFQLNITKPDGTTQIIGPWDCRSSVASDFQILTPDQVGTYTIVFSWSGDTVTENLAAGSGTYITADIGDKFLGATSEPATLVVQNQSIPTYPETPLPTEYWTRPINAQNRDWSTLPSNWLKGTWINYGYQKASTAPKSSHVLWTEPVTASSPSSAGYPGGLVDAQWPTLQANINDYLSIWSTPIIMNGIIYYNAPQTAQSCQYGYYATNLYTGEQLWYKNGTDNGLIGTPYTISTPGQNTVAYGENFAGLTLGQLYNFYSVDGNGINSYLWMQTGTTWYMLDSTTGNLILTLKNVPSGTSANDENGNLLRYSYSAAKGQFLCWNSSQAIYRAGPTGFAHDLWRPPIGLVIDAVNDLQWTNASTTWGIGEDPAILEALKKPHSGYSMNVTSDSLKGLPGTITILQDENRVPKQIFGKSIVTTYTLGSAPPTADTIMIWLANINEHATSYSPFPTLPDVLNTNLGFTISVVYNKTITVPKPGMNYTWTIPVVDYESGIFILHCQQLMQKWCYSLETGELLWGPTIQTPPMGFYATGGYGGLQGGVYDGIYLAIDPFAFYGQIYAYNITNGNLLWIYNATTPYPYESPYGSNMDLILGAVCDGMVYTYSTEHSPTNPLWRESYIRCINITDGTLIWKLKHFAWSGPAIADGCLVSCSQYDNLIYCIGKGPSGTTVSAPLSGVTEGNSFTITGTVTDQSPGALAFASKYGLMNGVAAISDNDQEAYMEYLYEQQVKPTNAIGVPVDIHMIDPNGNFIDLGTVNSDINGFYSFQVNPDMLTAGPGTYRVTATFAGSNSYCSSNAESAFTLNSAAPTATVAPVTVQQPTEMYIIGGVVAILIAIAIGFAVTILVLRKRP